MIVGARRRFRGGPGHLLPNQKKLAKKREDDKKSHADVGTTFTHFGTLQALDEEVIARWIVTNSDIELRYLKLAKSYDKQAPYHLFAYATQISLSWVVLAVLRNVVLFLQFADWRRDVCGDRLRDFAKKRPRRIQWQVGLE